MKTFKKSMFLLFVAAISLWAVQAGASIIPTLYNTGLGGVDNSDLHYSLIVNPNDASTKAYVVSNSQWPVGPVGGGTFSIPWAANTVTSSWIAPLFTKDGPADLNYVSNAVGTYKYQTTFDLTGFNSSSVTIAGKWWTDNYMNGIALNGVNIYSPSPSNLESFKEFSITSGFVTGINTLTFEVVNEAGPPYGNPTGLRVEFTTKEAAPVPIPAAVWLLGSGLLGLTFLRRKIKG